MNKKPVNVEDFSGDNNRDKIQNAINFAMNNGRSLEFTKIYDITGLGSLTMEKVSPGKVGTFYIRGNGGGIIKNDNGYIFDNSSLPNRPRISDTNVEGMFFESAVKTTVTNVWNLDYFLRLNSANNTYKGIDSVGRADTDLVQSVRFHNESIRGGNNYAFLANWMVDVTISECLIEDRNPGWGYSGGGIANAVSSSLTRDKTSNINIRIENNVIEGMDLCGVKLGNCVSSTIKGNYMESNTGGYFDLWTLVDDNTYSISLDFSGNHIQQSAQQVAANTPGLKIKNVLPSDSTFKQKSNSFFSNNRAVGVLYETNSFINSLGDYTSGSVFCIPMDKLILVAGQNTLPVNAGTGALATVASGIAYGFRKTQTVGIQGGEKKKVSIDVINAYFFNPITDNSIVSVTTSDLTNIKIHGYNWNFKSVNVTTVNIAIENLSASFLSVPIHINVINLGE
ncbi:hypothetical protein BKC07_04365 [Peribacillus simplex]|nr:hypothetical protein BKC07_04365 [Peribacillus simplex]